MVDGNSAHGVDHQHLGDEVSGILGQIAGNCVDTVVDLAEEVGDKLIIEWETTAEQRVEDDTTTPHIDLGTRIRTGEKEIEKGRKEGEAVTQIETDRETIRILMEWSRAESE